ncbi:MAG: Holliday junction branch migration protein RuvA [bacterium]|nr:Holliday junction branch migration protein RuvA [bacterium]
MYDYLNGIITNIYSNSIVLDVSGIGYLIYTANPYQFNEGEKSKIYIYQKVSEDENTLYGFKQNEERELFLKLINVKGLGPKMALPIIATGSVSGVIDAIERENILYLKKFPKIGDKVAKQIILDLKGKLGVITTSGEVVDSNTYDELIEVLKGLGYKEKEYKKIISKIDDSLSIEEQVKEALKLLLK